MRLVPRTMSTQHPDNASMPDWIRSDSIEGEDEVREAFLSYSSYGTQEVMWDSEGKDVDLHVVRKLLSSFPGYFKEHVIGRDIFLTYRIPNPRIEGAERKVFAETLESISTSFDVAERFYGKPVPAVFEVILPFTTSSAEIISVAKYYEKVVVGKENIELEGGLPIRELVGEVNPKSIEVIPLVEDKDSLLRIREVVGGYVKAVRPKYIRVFVARSDPAMNYGLIPALILAKWALRELRKIDVQVFPIVGVGSAPFRGNLRPSRIESALKEYEGFHTFTVQSSFKYDNPEIVVREAVKRINESEPHPMEWEDARSIVEIYVERYQREVEALANAINHVAPYVPKRRARKLHVGLFGYSRSNGKVTLPRAITFVGSLYSLGIPPEVLGLYSLSKLREDQWDVLKEVYLNMIDDLRDSLRFADPGAPKRLASIGVNDEVRKLLEEDMRFAEDVLNVKVGGNDYESRTHALLSQMVSISLEVGRADEIKRNILEMAKLRGFLG